MEKYYYRLKPIKTGAPLERPSWIEISVWPSALIENWWALTICLPQDLLNLLRSEGIHMPYAQQEIRLRPMGFDKSEE